LYDYRTEAPEILKEFLAYHEDIRIHSPRTIDEYFLDLRTFFRFLKLLRKEVPPDTPLEEIDIRNVDVEFVKKITKSEITDYTSFLRRDRVLYQRDKYSEVGVNDNTLHRKMACLRSFFKYLTVKAGKLNYNPMEAWDMPKRKQALPKYLTLDESMRLLQNIKGAHKTRDYCILTVFLQCGLRISELCSLNLSDIRRDHIRVTGKGNKERVVYINDATAEALNAYLYERVQIPTTDKALFISQKKNERLKRSGVHALVKKHLGEAGLYDYSAHKLRHTAATLMLKNGVDVRVLQEVLGHEHLNTTQIYTHVESSDLRTAALAHPMAKFTTDKQ
jgi:site-specific recombinase XerD